MIPYLKSFCLLLLLALLLCAFANLTQGQSAASSRQAASSSVSPGRTASVTPTNSTNYRLVAEQAARAAGISAWVFVRQINEESGFDPAALSSAGAEGIAQFMPATAKALGINPWDPIASLYAAARLMASYVRQYAGSYAKALAAYNAGPGMVAYAVARGGSAWRSFLPAETQTYIAVILGA